MKILIIQTKKLGDIVLTTSVIKPLKERWPDSYIAFLVEDTYCEVLLENPYIDEIIPVKKGIFSKIGLIIRIRREKFDIILDFICYPTTSIITFASCARKRIGFTTRKIRNLAYNLLIRRDLQGDRYALYFKKLFLLACGINVENIEPSLFISDRARKKVSLFLENCGVKPSDYLVSISPTSAIPTKRWRKEAYAELADRLIKDGIKVIFLYGPGEAKIIEEIVALMKEKPIVSFETTIKEVCAFIEKSRLLIGNDNGLVHIAFALKIPTITIYGQGNPKCWLPNDEKHKAIKADIPCIGCGKEKCKELTCMKLVSVDEVFKWTKSLL